MTEQNVKLNCSQIREKVLTMGEVKTVPIDAAGDMKDLIGADAKDILCR